MNLSKKSEDPRRRITWRGKSLASCSKSELIECIINLSSQLVAMQKKPTAPVPGAQDGSTISERTNEQITAYPGAYPGIEIKGKKDYVGS